MLVEVILPVKLPWNPVYRAEVPLHRGQRARVKLAGKEYIGTVFKTDATPNCELSKIQGIDGAAEGFPDISEAELNLWEFISEYYLCSIGEVYKAAYPGAEVKSEEAAAKRKKKTATKKDEEEVETSEVLFPTLEAGKPVLLEGWDRTPTYVNAVRESLDAGYQTLILAPDNIDFDILKKTLEPYFPDEFLCFNSRITAVQRRRIADALRSTGPAVVLGTRSSIFLPFSKLGLIIVDEEQDTSFKQDSPAPRYNARDCAIVLSRIHKAKILLGSCCPSLESLLNCHSGKYTLFEKNGQNGIIPEIVDVNAEKRKRGMNGILSRKLLEACGEVYGKIALIKGWEKAEELDEEIKRLLPGREVEVLSLTDARRSDLSKYAIVAVLQIDALSAGPMAAAKMNRKGKGKPDYSAIRADFRTDERLLQLFTWLRGKCRRLVIQTARPLGFNLTGDQLLAERKQFNFPPYSRLVEIRNRHGEITGRKFLKKGPEAAAEKRMMASELKDGYIIDVDPV